MFMQIVSSKSYQACHNIANGIKQGRLIKMLPVAQKLYVGAYVRCINCSYNNVAKGIHLLDKKTFFVYTGKKFMQVRSFERYIPLSLSYAIFTKFYKLSQLYRNPNISNRTRILTAMSVGIMDHPKVLI